MKTLSILAAALALAAPAAALASPHVVSASPVAGSTVAGPKVLTLGFSEPVNPASAAAAIVMTAMPGMANHGEMPIRNFTTQWSEGNRKLTLTLRQPLRTGTYDLRWMAAGADGSKGTGKVTFVVR